jgi:two-component system, sensor histidine kinase and response regulator
LHLTWQTQQIADGDYNQKVDFMGDFSIAFNKMTSQLKSSFYEINCKNKELAESEKKLREANATKDKFFSIIAHDLRNPIGNFSNMLDLLIDDQYDLSEDKKHKILKNIKFSAEQTFSLLENLLNWSRSQQKTIKYNPEQYNINDMIEDTISLFTISAENKSIYFVADLKERYIACFDYSTINTVFRNLVSNAIKFTKENGTIKIIVNNFDNYLEIIIEDNGIGISEEKLKMLFKMDENVTSRGTKGEPGSGLGLILCKEFIEKNNGEIRVESELGKGTKFIFTLPKIS